MTMVEKIDGLANLDEEQIANDAAAL